MKTIYIYFISFIAITFFSGCATKGVKINTQSYQPVLETNNTTPIKPKEILPKKIASIKASKINVNIINTDDNTESLFITKRIQAALLNAGFSIDPTASSTLTIYASNSFEQYDKYGNYYIFKGTSSLKVKSDKRLLSQDELTINGDRKLGEVVAKKSAANKLADLVSKEIENVGNKVLENLISSKITLNIKVLKKAFGSDINNLQQSIDELINETAILPGVLSCSKLSNDWKNLILEVTYMKKAYPNGFIYEFVDTRSFNSNPQNKVLYFMKKLYKKPVSATLNW